MTNNYDIVDKEGIFGQREVAENRPDSNRNPSVNVRAFLTHQHNTPDIGISHALYLRKQFYTLRKRLSHVTGMPI